MMICISRKGGMYGRHFFHYRRGMRKNLRIHLFVHGVGHRKLLLLMEEGMRVEYLDASRQIQEEDADHKYEGQYVSCVIFFK